MFAFLVLVQLGPLVALLVYFWKDYWSLIKTFFARTFSSAKNKMARYVIIATIPAGLAGILLKDLVQSPFQNPLLEAAIGLSTAATLLFLAEWLGKKSCNLSSITWLGVLIVSLFEVLAVFPSRDDVKSSEVCLYGLNSYYAHHKDFARRYPRTRVSYLFN